MVLAALALCDSPGEGPSGTNSTPPPPESPAEACCRVRATECSSAYTEPFEGGRLLLHYLHHSLASGQTTGREHSPAHQQKIELKIY